MNTRWRQFFSTLLFWSAMAVPVAMCSAVLANWPEQFPFPWKAACATSLAILVGIVIVLIIYGIPSDRVNDTADEEEGKGYVFRRAMSRVRWFVLAVLVSGALGCLLQCLMEWPAGSVQFSWTKVAVVPVCVMLGVAAFGLFMIMANSHWARRHASVVLYRKHRWRVVGAVSAAMTVGAFFVFLECRLVDTGSGFVWSCIHNPGGIFAFCVGVGTLVGMYLAVESLLVAEQRITTFADLAKRLVRLIIETKGTHEDDYVRYLCYTPLTGSFALPDHRYRELRDLITDAVHPVSIVTLNQDALKEWLEDFDGRTTAVGIISRAKIDKAVREAEDACATLASQAASETRPGLAQHIAPVRLTRERMPGYYFYSNGERAIIVAPMFLPLPRGTPKQTQVEKLESVQMVGIETGDPAVVAWVNKLHNVYRTSVAAIKEFISSSEAQLDSLTDSIGSSAKSIAPLAEAANKPV